MAARLRDAGVALIASAAIASAVILATIHWGVAVPLSGPIADGGWTGRTRAWVMPRGFYPGEVDEARGQAFSWTGAHAELLVPQIDRSQAYKLGFRIAAGRGPGVAPPPELRIYVDGVLRFQAQTSNDPTSYAVIAPPSPDRALRLVLELSNTFVPGPQDRRTLGVILQDVSIEPLDGAFRVTPRVFGLVVLATLAYVAAVLACGVPAVWAVAVAAGVAGAHAWLLAFDGAFMGDTVYAVVRMGAGVAVIGAGVGLLRRLRVFDGRYPEWGIAVALVLVPSAIKFAFFHHPRVTIGDSIFQVHRAQAVATGHYFFTSVTPRPFFEFPYAIALYVNAMPFWSAFPAELDRVLLLRGLTITADALVGIGMYFALRRAWQSGWAALLFAGLWPFARAPLQALCTSNLTNLYGQGLFGAGMAVVCWMAARPAADPAAPAPARPPANRTAWIAGTAAMTILFALGFLSHFSTFSVGVPLAGLVGVLLVVFQRGDGRRLGWCVLAAVLLAAAASYAVYYSHFTDVYRATLQRVAAREGEAETRSMVAPAAVKAGRWATESLTNFGVPLALCALGGAIWLVRRRPAQAVTTVLAGWTLTWLIFSALGIATAIEMRSNLATAPLMLALAVFGLSALSRSSRAGAVLAVLGALAIAGDGFMDWMMCLTGHR